VDAVKKVAGKIRPAYIVLTDSWAVKLLGGNKGGAGWMERNWGCSVDFVENISRQEGDLDWARPSGQYSVRGRRGKD